MWNNVFVHINVHTLNHEIKQQWNLNYTCICSPSNTQTSVSWDYANNFGIYLLCGSSKQLITVTGLRAVFNNRNSHGPFLNWYKTDVRGPGLSHSQHVQMETYNLFSYKGLMLQVSCIFCPVTLKL
jgi:hypothetical protein